VAADAVVVALEKAQDARVGVLHAAELDLVNVLRAPALEMRRKALSDEADRRVELGELVGTRTGAVLRQPLAAPVAALLVFLDKLLVDDMDLGHNGEEYRRWLRQ